MFAGHLRKGQKRKPVGAGIVRFGIGGVNTTIAMDTGRQPLHQPDQTHYTKPLQHMRARFKNFDSATEKKLTCHPDLPASACKFGYRCNTSGMQKSWETSSSLHSITCYGLMGTRPRRGTRRKQGRCSSGRKIYCSSNLTPTARWLASLETRQTRI